MVDFLICADRSIDFALDFEDVDTGSGIGANAGEPVNSVGRTFGEECICDGFRAGEVAVGILCGLCAIPALIATDVCTHRRNGEL